MKRTLSAVFTSIALACAFAPAAYAAETPPPASDTAPGMSPSPGGMISPGTMAPPPPIQSMQPGNPPAADVAPGHVANPGGAMPIPMEPTAAGMSPGAKPEPHAQAVRGAKTQYAQDKESCRENTMTKQEFRDCKKAAKMERNERIKDSPAQIPVAP